MSADPRDPTPFPHPEEEFDDYVEQLAEYMEEQVFNFIGSEAHWFRFKAALKVLIEREEAGWDQASEERKAEAEDS